MLGVRDRCYVPVKSRPESVGQARANRRDYMPETDRGRSNGSLFYTGSGSAATSVMKSIMS